MTNNTAHASCTHPRTKVARARCRKARALASTRTEPTYILVTAKGSKVVHRTAGDIDENLFACTKKLIKDDATINDRGHLSDVTCKNCLKLPA